MISSLDKALLYARTISYLKPSQLYYRLWFKIKKNYTRIDYSIEICSRSRCFKWKAPISRKSSLTDIDEFNFFYQKARISNVGWNGEGQSVLWRYNQHYFDDLNSENCANRKPWHRSLILSWISNNKIGKGVGWDPYPTSLRIVNWIKWTLSGNQLTQESKLSLHLQMQWLMQRIEYHLLANHLFTNAKALIFAGLFFKGPTADLCFEKGIQIVEAELDEQILADGGHFERSPMYHSIILEDILDLLNLLEEYNLCSTKADRLRHRLSKVVQPMFTWLNHMVHKDGEISFFNDAAIGIAPNLSQLAGYAQSLGFGLNNRRKKKIKVLKESGYISLRNDIALLILDCGLVGPDYQPAHVHADTLSFELSVGSKRVIVNSGTSLYEEGEKRTKQRGTAAHNTVSIDGKNSSEVWGAFRVGRRACPFDLEILEREKFTQVNCSHDGYRHIKDKPTHNRQWIFEENRLIVKDEVSRLFGKERAEAMFFIHPDAKVTSQDQDGMRGVLRFEDQMEVIWSVRKGKLRIEETFWYPEFGLDIPNYCLVVRLESGCSEVHFLWEKASTSV